MKQQRILHEVERVARRLRGLRRGWALAATWTAAAVAGAVLLWGRAFLGWDVSWAAPVVGGAAAVAALVVAIVVWRSTRDARPIARRIETRSPELDTRLLAALEQRPALPDGRFGFLQETVLSEVLAHARRGRWLETVPARRLRLARTASVVSLAVLALALSGLLFASRSRPPGSPITGGVAIEELDGRRHPCYEVEVDPGDAEIERGSSLLVLARFAAETPSEVTLVTRRAGAEERHAQMAKSLDDPLFGARVPAVDEGLSYRVEFAGDSSPWYEVGVYVHPEVNRVDAELTYPAYTGLEPRTVLDTRRVSAVEGTELRWVLHLNKPAAAATLVDAEDESIDLTAAEGENVYVARMTLARSNRYRVRLVDDRGRENRAECELVVAVLPDRLPEIGIVSPSRDVRVSPLEELTTAATVSDDFGLQRCGLSYTLGGGAPNDVVLGEGGSERLELRYMLDFEALQVEPDQLVSYYFWAEDLGPGNQSRRTFGDMYFAEVRHFEEIFRQGEQPAGGEAEERERRQREQGQDGEGGQNAQDAEELAELQKQIIAGTWQLIRRDSAGGPAAAEESDGDLVTDGALLRDAQQSALEQAGGLGARLEDAESLRHLEVVTTHMLEALEKLAQSVDEASADPLRPALAAEQAAYQALLRLRAREHQVIRGRQRGQSGSRSGSRGGRSERQLQELQLTDSRNRYETQRSASSRTPESPAEREDRQVSNRLRELARRQADLNERLKELQSALAEARSEEERAELERQLKRLRDDEREILRDTDELAERMDRAENRDRMAEARDRLGDTRENVRRASDALQEGQVAPAVAEGTRAERELNELREEFRRRTAGRFAEEVQELRSEAERLERNEEDLGRRLAELDDARRSSLRGTGDREGIERGLEEQAADLERLLESMQETVEQAEAPEPLLAERLYDTIRRTRQSRTEESLDLAKQLLERGFVEESTEVERQARDGIRRLREGIDRAAEGVLGDGTESLRQARQELDRLTDDVEREIARAESGESGPSGRPGDREAANERRARDGERRAEGEPREGGERPGQGGPAGAAGDRDRERAGDPGELARGEPQQGRGGGRQPGEGRRGQQQQPGQARGGEQPGEGRGGRGQQPPDAAAPGERETADGRGARRGARGGVRGGGAERRSGLRGGGPDDGGGPLAPFLKGDEVAREGAEDGAERRLSPIAGEDFREWSDRLRDVEEMVDDPDLSAEASRIRDRARGIRGEVTRHSRAPDWDLVRVSIVEPLNELRRRVTEELLRRESNDSLVPIDADPVPPEFSERVRKYYERLGRGE